MGDGGTWLGVRGGAGSGRYRARSPPRAPRPRAVASRASGGSATVARGGAAGRRGGPRREEPGAARRRGGAAGERRGERRGGGAAGAGTLAPESWFSSGIAFLSLFFAYVGKDRIFIKVNYSNLCTVNYLDRLCQLSRWLYHHDASLLKSPIKQVVCCWAWDSPTLLMSLLLARVGKDCIEAWVSTDFRKFKRVHCKLS